MVKKEQISGYRWKEDGRKQRYTTKDETLMEKNSKNGRPKQQSKLITMF